MRISAISGTINTNNNVHSKPVQKTFRGSVMAAAIKKAKYPNDVFEWQQKCYDLLQATMRESNCNISSKDVFEKLLNNAKQLDSLMEFINNSFKKYLSAGEGASLATEPKGCILLLAREDIIHGKKSNFIQFTDGSDFAQFGIADIYDGNSKINFYHDNQVYIDYHNNGGIRKFVPIIGSAEYYKRDGSRDYFGGIKDLINSF